jgi:hypothetical protein
MHFAHHAPDMTRSNTSTVAKLAIAIGGVALASAAVVAWWRRSSAPVADADAAQPVKAASVSLFEDAAPDSFSFEADLPPEPQLSARPTTRGRNVPSPDDYDAFSPEDLGALFLAGATDTALDEPPASTAEVSGFQIFEPGSPNDDTG